MPDRPPHDGVIEALLQGDVAGSMRLARAALAEAHAEEDVDAAARFHLALVGLARLGGDPGAGARELRDLQEASERHPGSSLETAHDLARARFLLDAGDASRALAALRTATLRQAAGVGPDLSGAVLADLLVATARERVAHPDLADDLTRALLALAPPELAGPAMAALAEVTGLGGGRESPIGEQAVAEGPPEQACWWSLAAAAGAVRTNDLEQARRLLMRARQQAVGAREPLGYSLSAMLLFLVQVAGGDPVKAVGTALRAKASLDDLLGPGGGDEFKALLELWREAVGTATFDGYLRSFVLARQGEKL